MKIGYQLYSARDDAAKDLRAVLSAVRDMGYDGVEFAGFYGHGADEVRGMLDELGLKAISCHAMIPDTIEGKLELIAFLKRVGCEFSAIPFTDEAHRPGGPLFAATIREIYAFGALLRQAGMQLLYHNHNFEFEPLSGEFGLDFLYDAVPAEILKTEIDVCWVKYAGHDPAAYVRKYAGRAPLVHLKDYVGTMQKGKNPFALLGQDGKDDGSAQDVPFEFRPVGHGCQDLPAVVKAAKDAGAGWVIVEQDLSVGRTPLEAAKMSIESLRALGL